MGVISMEYIINRPGSSQFNFPEYLNVQDKLVFNNTGTGPTGTIIDWIVPVSGIYRIRVCGASGGDSSSSSSSYSGGKGAILEGNILLYKNEKLKILVGHKGIKDSYRAGGGGGTFVVRVDESSPYIFVPTAEGVRPLIIAGGGGGANLFRNGGDAYTTVGDGNGVRGGGFFTNGSSGYAFLNGGNGNGRGGFGGGGNEERINMGTYAGAGGGYTGGGFGTWETGAGGTSYIDISMFNVATSDGYYDNNSMFKGEPIINLNEYNSFDGKVEITLLSLINSTFIKISDKFYTFVDNSWVETELIEPLSEQDFETYGIKNIWEISQEKWNELNSNFEIITFIDEDNLNSPKLVLTVPEHQPYKLLDNPSIVTWVEDDNYVPKLSINTVGTEIYWAIKINESLYTYYENEWITITQDEVYNKGMTKEVLESLNYNNFSAIFEEGTIQLVGCAKTNDQYTTWYIQQVNIALPFTASTGTAIIETKDNYFNTIDWARVNSVSIMQYIPENADIRYAFSNDNKATWKVFRDNKWQTITDTSQGMTSTEVELVTDWDEMIKSSSYTLHVRATMINNSTSDSPYIDSIVINYDKIPNPEETNIITIPVPDKGLRNVLIEGVYNLKLVEGVAFDDATVDYNFYTTPDKIKLRPLDMGTIIGGKYSNIYAVEIINGHEAEDFLITLYAIKGGVAAEQKENYGLFYDAEYELNRTKIEFSLTGGEDFKPEYPLKFILYRNSSKIFYVRIKPTLTTAGYDTFQIRLNGVPL